MNGLRQRQLDESGNARQIWFEATGKGSIVLQVLRAEQHHLNKY